MPGRATAARHLPGLGEGLADDKPSGDKPDGDSTEVFGQPLDKNLLGILARTGSLIEGPSYYPNLTGAENLAILQRLLKLPAQRVDETLEIVGLTGARGKLAKSYSLGMKQRLGIAMALLANPQLLIHEGILRYQGPLTGLRDTGSLVLRTSDNQSIRESLRQWGCPVSDTPADTPVEVPGEVTDLNRARIVGYVLSEGVDVYELAHRRRSLEDVFLDLTAGLSSIPERAAA